jgi:hypothetical protein
MSVDNVISVRMLINLGLLKPNAELIWKRRSTGNTYVATVNADGSIRTADGSTHKSPSGAARHLNSRKPIDGWNVWRVLESNETLGELRNRANQLR